MKRGMKRGQVSIEFLMTYGWAIIVMLGVVAVLYVLNVFTPTPPTGCVLQAGFACRGFKVNASNMTLNLIQTTGHAIYIDQVACSAQENSSSVTYTNVSQRLYSSETVQLIVPCFNSAGIRPATGDYFSGTFYMKYTDEETNIRHTLVGQIAYKVE